MSCPTGNPLLDQQATRTLLDSLYKLAGGDSVPSKKLERGGYLYEDSTGTMKYVVLPPDPADNACKTQSSLSQPYPGTIIAGVHIHPFKHYDVTDICHPPDPSKTNHYNGNSCVTFSCSDLDSRLIAEIIEYGAAYEGMIVMDKEKIAFARPGTTSTNVKKSGWKQQWKRQQSSCQIA